MVLHATADPRRIEAEDAGVAVMRYRSGALGVLEVSMLTHPKNLEGSVTILGEHGNVKIGGDLGQIDVNSAGTGTVLTSLTVQSIGAWGTATQGANGSTTSNILGKVGAAPATGDAHMRTPNHGYAYGMRF